MLFVVCSVVLFWILGVVMVGGYFFYYTFMIVFTSKSRIFVHDVMNKFPISHFIETQILFSNLMFH